IDFGFGVARGVDREIEHVEDDVAIVGDDALAVDRIAAELDQLARHITARHRDHLDRQRKLAEGFDQLALIGNADEFPGAGGDNFLACQRRTAALDQFEAGVRFVGAVDVIVKGADRVQVENLDTVFSQSLGRGIGTGDGTFEIAADIGEQIDKTVRCRAGADTEHGLFIQTIADQIECGFGDSLLECVLIHVRLQKGWVNCFSSEGINGGPALYRALPAPQKLNAELLDWLLFTPKPDFHRPPTANSPCSMTTSAKFSVRAFTTSPSKRPSTRRAHCRSGSTTGCC